MARWPVSTFPLLPCVPPTCTGPLLTLLLPAHQHMYSALLLFLCMGSHRLLTTPPPSLTTQTCTPPTSPLIGSWTSTHLRHTYGLGVHSPCPAPEPEYRPDLPCNSHQVPRTSNTSLPCLASTGRCSIWPRKSSNPQELCRGIWRAPVTRPHQG
jgi:hypothetical protein